MKPEFGVEAVVTIGRASNLAPVPGFQPTKTDNVVANVCVNGQNYDSVRRARELILNQSPITMVSYHNLLVNCC
jgi:hypothetical protein